MSNNYGRGQYKIVKSGGSFTLMCDDDKLAIVVPLSETVYGPDSIGLLLEAMCALVNDSGLS